MDWRLDRTLPISITEQIKGQIMYAISYRMLKAGDALPSVRELAEILDVSPVTISKVYRELAQQDLIFSKPGVGTFVSEMSRLEKNISIKVAQERLQRFIHDCVQEANLMGFTLDDLLAALLKLKEQLEMQNGHRALVVVGNYKPATASYAQEIEEILHDMNVQVIPLVLSDLQVNLQDHAEMLSKAKLAITVPPALHEVADLLEPIYCPVAAVAFRVSSSTLRALAEIKPTDRIGVLSITPEYLQTMLDTVLSYCLPQRPPLSAILGQEAQIQNILSQIDVLIYSSGSEGILSRLPEGVKAIEMRNSPEPESINRLRPLIE
jgi:DNA-binding transcriptional regulator YhcF (GntR family)